MNRPPPHDRRHPVTPQHLTAHTDTHVATSSAYHTSTAAWNPDPCPGD